MAWEHLTDERSRRAVEVPELYADGLVTADARERACRDACDARDVLRTSRSGRSHLGEADVLADQRFTTACYAAFIAGARRIKIDMVNSVDLNWLPRSDQSNLIRDFFNPFRPVTADPSWLTSTVVALARQMYESRDFSAMPILADALQDAGCENDDVLKHCRGTGPHVRGCWVVDLVLGKG